MLGTDVLLVIGAGGFAKEVNSYVRHTDGLTDVLHFDDRVEPGMFGCMNVVGPIAMVSQFQGQSWAAAVGNNMQRKALVERVRMLTVTDPVRCVRARSSVIGDEVRIGRGTVIAPGAVLTADLSVGEHCIINVGACVAHDCVVGDFANINPGAMVMGGAQIGTGAFVGAGAVVLPGIVVGDWATVGAGAVVTRHVAHHSVVVGVPARVFKHGL